MGDVERGDAQVSLDAGNVGTHLHPKFGVEVRQWLVHQEQFRLAHDGSAHSHPLALPTGEIRWLLVQLLGDLENLGSVFYLLSAFGFRDLAEPQREADVVRDTHLRVQGVTLEHHGDVAVFGCNVVHAPVTDVEVTVGNLFEPGNHAQRGGFATA